MHSLTTSARNMPKMSIPTLEIRKNYYVIHDGDQYHYFAIKIEEEVTDKPIMRFDRAPPVLIEGVAIIGKKLYRVPIMDLMRGIIRKSREIHLANRVTTNGSSGNATNPDGTGYSSTGPNSATSSVTQQTVQYTDQPGANDSPELEVDKAANAAWVEQIDSLLSFISEKEGIEWEIADSAQSRPVDESSTV